MLVRSHRLKLVGMQRQFCVWQAEMKMMHAMKWLMEQRESHQPPAPAFRDDITRRAIHRAAGQTDMLDVFPPRLEVRGHESRS